jgi:hypothetical protein
MRFTTPLYAIASLLLIPSLAFAKEGTIVQGENGTVWCCQNGQKGKGCEQGTAGTPIGAACNFANDNLVVPDVKVRDVRLRDVKVRDADGHVASPRSKAKEHRPVGDR